MPEDAFGNSMQLLPDDYALYSQVVAVTVPAQNVNIPTGATLMSIYSEEATTYIKFSGEGTPTASPTNFDDFIPQMHRIDRKLPSEAINSGTISLIATANTNAIIIFM